MNRRLSMHKHVLRWLFAAGCLALVGSVGCSDDSGQTNAKHQDAGTDTTTDSSTADAGDVQPDGGTTTAQADCDSLQPDHCALPWPSNLYLKPDDSRVTGYTLNFGENTLPKSDTGGGIQTRPDPYRRLDGYGPGTPLLVNFPNIDTSNIAGETNIADSLNDDAPIVWLEVDDSGNVVRKIPYFAELDENGTTPENTVLFVRPAVILKESTRYVVAFRNLKDTSGNAIAPSDAFKKLRDGDTSGDPVLAARQARFDDIFSILDAQGIQKSNLTLAWDFVTASNQALHGSMLHIRDKGLELAGQQGPELTITDVKENDFTGSDPANADSWWLEIKGTFEVPRFMKDSVIDGQPGPTMNWGDDGMPKANGTITQPFWLYVPQSARNSTPQGLIEYGHGLLGTGAQTHGSFNRDIANKYNFIYFGTNMAGMAEEDQSRAIFALSDLNGFPFLADRLQQGMLDYLLLARAMRERLQDVDEIKSRNITVDSSQLYYSGISQGGIFGGTVIALSTDMTYAHCGVPGNNYSTLLQRSKDFNAYFIVLRNNYKDPLKQAVALSTIQLLWDQTDPVSYLRHITAEPFDGNDPHYALFTPAKGDNQVSPLTDEIAARSDIGIKLMANYPRDVDLVDPQPYPYTGSGIVMYDFGNPWPEPGNHPPQSPMDDPHEFPRRTPAHQKQLAHYFHNDGEIIDVCDAGTCTFESPM